MVKKIKQIKIPSMVYIALLIIILGLFGYYIYTSRGDNFITVTGTATAQFDNQISSYSVTLEFHDVDKSKAVDRLNEKTKEVTEKIKEFGIDPKDIKTQNLNVYQREEPYMEGGVTKYRPNEWYASYTIEVKLRDLSRSEELTGVLVSIENSNMWGPNLMVDENDTDYAEILSKAVDDAREKAENLAASSGKKVGKVISIVEGGPSQDFIGLREGAMGAGGGFPIEPGSTSITKTVTVTFELK